MFFKMALLVCFSGCVLKHLRNQNLNVIVFKAFFARQIKYKFASFCGVLGSLRSFIFIKQYDRHSSSHLIMNVLLG